jgi:hypothetical protein
MNSIFRPPPPPPPPPPPEIEEVVIVTSKIVERNVKDYKNDGNRSSTQDQTSDSNVTTISGKKTFYLLNILFALNTKYFDASYYMPVS